MATTAKKYHISPETGRPNQCTATVRGCKYAVDGEMPEHYNSKEDARKAYEGQNADKTVQSVSKKETPKLSSRKLSIEEIASSERIQGHYSVAAKARLRLAEAQRDLKEANSYRDSLVKNNNDIDKWGASRIIEKINALNKNHGVENTLNSRDYEIKKLVSVGEDSGAQHYSITYDKDKLRNDIYDKIVVAQREIAEKSSAENFWKKSSEKAKENLVKQYGYAENPRFGVPTNESTFGKWDGKQARNYSSHPTRDVPILKDAQKYCTKCNESLVEIGSGYSATYVHESSKDSKCADGGFKQQSITCRYCGTSDSSMVSFSQQSWSDETSCKRCGGVDGYAIGD